MYETNEAVVELRADDFSVLSVKLKKRVPVEIRLHQAAAMRVLLDNLKNSPLAKVASGEEHRPRTISKK